MAKKSEIAVILDEWDGDRSSGFGGFTIEILIGKEFFEKRGSSYRALRDRSGQLREMRKKARAVAKILGVKLQENLYN